MFVLDSHCDTPSQILRLRDLSKDNEYAHVDFPKLKRGGVDGAFFALYIPAGLDSDSDKAFEYAQRLLDGVKDTVAANCGTAAFAVSQAEAMGNKSNGLFSVFLGLENGSPIGVNMDRLHWFHSEGVRYITLCHSGNNQICDSCAPKSARWGGLSPFGKELVREMNRLGILVDVSHISDASFYDVLECSQKPVVATHSCCRSLADHPRNMTDDMIRALASSGGVMQINFYPLFIDSSFKHVLAGSGIMERGEQIESEFIADPGDMQKREAWNRIQDELKELSRPSFRLIADHIDHAVELAGIDHVGIGSDFDGIEVTPEGLENIGMMPVLFDELRSRGYTESDLAKIAGENFFRIL
jgi:membrane dipeptidase